MPRAKTVLQRMLRDAIPSERSRQPSAENAAALRVARRIVDDLEDSRNTWFWSTDCAGNLTYLSEPFAQDIGLIGMPLGEISMTDVLRMHNTLPGVHQRTIPYLLASHSQFDQIAVTAPGDPDNRIWAISGKPTLDDDGAFEGFRGTGIDISERVRLALEAEQSANFDPLTGLANRARIAQELDRQLTAKLREQRSVALLLIDLDRFKQVNDTLGHPIGDALLKQVAQRIRRVVGTRGMPGRIGGDEFQIVVADVDDRGVLAELASEVISELSQSFVIEGSRCTIGASIGIAVAPFDAFNADELGRAADLALYAAKGAGRGRHAFYSRGMHAEAEERRVLEEDLRDAVAKGELQNHYQPLVATDTGRIIGVETLMRWHHPERGTISPSLFIGLAEENGLISQIGEWCLRQACVDAASWPDDLKVAVNVSAVQFAQARFPEVVAQALANSGLPPHRLELEITETVFLADLKSAESMFAALKRIGVRLALDDFGTGYSSLRYLQNAPFDKIKIDQSFVNGATVAGNRNAALIAAIVSMAEALGMDTTAEGLETLDQLELVRKLRVNQIQGYVYSPPLTHAELKAKIASGDLQLRPRGPARQRPHRQTVYRKVGVIHDDFRYEAILRNLSATGALIEGIYDVPLGTSFVIDFGDGQLAVSEVVRATGRSQGVVFEDPLIEDGAGGLCTRNRVSPYVLAAAGMPHVALPPGTIIDVASRHLAPPNAKFRVA